MIQPKYYLVERTLLDEGIIYIRQYPVYCRCFA